MHHFQSLFPCSTTWHRQRFGRRFPRAGALGERHNHHVDDAGDAGDAGDADGAGGLGGACRRSGSKQQRDSERGDDRGCGEAATKGEEGERGEEEGEGRGGGVASRPWPLPCRFPWNKVEIFATWEIYAIKHQRPHRPTYSQIKIC